MSAPPNIFTAEGTLLAVGSNQPFWLTDRDSAWFIETGKVDLFTVPTVNGEPVGSRVHFLRVAAGQVLFAVAAAEQNSNLAFLAVGSSDARVYKLPLARLKELIRDPAGVEQLAAWIDQWVSGLYSGMCRGLPPQDFETLQPEHEAALTSAQSAHPEQGVVWVTQAGGTTHLA